MSNCARATAIEVIASDFRELWHCDYSQQVEFRIYSPDGDSRFRSLGGAAMASARISRSHWLALAGLVATLTIAAASCDPAQARVKSKRDHPRPRAIHGPSYHPPYADIVVDDKSGFVLGYNLTSSVRRDEKHIVAVVLGGTSNAARDARMRQLIEDNISLASTQRTAPIIVEANGQESPHQDNAHQVDALQDRAHVVAVAPATPNAEPPAGGSSAAAAASTKAEPVPLPRPRLQAAGLAARASKQAASAQALPARAQRLTAKASTLSVLQDISALRQTRHVERKVGSSTPPQ